MNQAELLDSETLVLSTSGDHGLGLIAIVLPEEFESEE